MKVTISELVGSMKPWVPNICGTRTVEREGGYFYELSEYTKESLEELGKETGETWYLVTKGATALLDFWENKDDEVLEFEDFKVRRESGLYTNLYMNVKEILLPPKKTITLEKSERIYVVRRDNNNKLEMFPSLHYPKAVVPLFKWLKKKKLIDFGVSEIFSITIKEENMDSYDLKYSYPMWNLKTEEQVLEYADYLDNDFFPRNGRPHLKTTLLRGLRPLKLEQSDIDRYVEETNNRYLVKR